MLSSSMLNGGSVDISPEPQAAAVFNKATLSDFIALIGV